MASVPSSSMTRPRPSHADPRQKRSDCFGRQANHLDLDRGAAVAHAHHSWSADRIGGRLGQRIEPIGRRGQGYADRCGADVVELEAYASGGSVAFGATLYGPAWTADLAPVDPEAVGHDLAMFSRFEPSSPDGRMRIRPRHSRRDVTA